jgi:hypothetical protein
MAYYLVHARPNAHLLPLRQQLDSGEIAKMRPFGNALDYSLKNARLEDGGLMVWEEEDYCSPPLAQEREAVLDKFFTDLDVERVGEGEGWRRIEHLPMAWEPGQTG